MQLDDLPDELIREILLILKKKDHRDFINAASTCKRLERIANDIILYARRSFKINMDHLVLLRLTADGEHKDAEELNLTTNFPSRVIESKHRVYEGLLIAGYTLKLDNFSPLEPDLSSEVKISALSTLHLRDCSVTIPWIHGMMTQLKGLRNVILQRVTYTEIEMDHPLIAPGRVLDRISIWDDMSYQTTDVILKYFLDYWPASILDITGSKVQRNTLVIKRFYRGYTGLIGSFNENKPSKFLLTFPMVYKYLKKHQNTVKILVIDYLELRAEDIEVILVDADLENLQIALREFQGRPPCLEYKRITMLKQLTAHQMGYRVRVLSE